MPRSDSGQQRESKRLSMDPSEVRFTQSSLSGISLDVMYSDLVEGRSTASDFPPIRVYRQHGEWWSLDNRRLAAFQLNGETQIPVQRVYLSHSGGHSRPGQDGPCTIRDEVAWKKTTTVDGTDIQFRLPGSRPEWLFDSRGSE
mmetsp:Transcript_30725/g.57541  ORF Transcript_30725/g.57541 Transcript_30725/m.57541 type:complete len:143 (-) Transcript_30725:173-601(-)